MRQGAAWQQQHNSNASTNLTSGDSSTQYGALCDVHTTQVLAAAVVSPFSVRVQQHADSPLCNICYRVQLPVLWLRIAA
jgi:methyl coenzyme M reductase subunit C